MDIEFYKKIVDRYKVKEEKLKNCFISFFVGGLVGLIGEVLMELYVNYLNVSKDVSASMMIISLIFISCLFTSLGFFDKWISYCKCGLIIPITGFAHSMMSCGLDYKSEGFIFGIGSNLFKLAGSVILYGVFSAWFFAIIRYLLGGV